MRSISLMINAFKTITKI